MRSCKDTDIDNVSLRLLAKIFGLFLQDAALSFSVFNGSRCAHHLEYFCCGFIFPRSSKGLFRIDIFLVEI